MINRHTAGCSLLGNKYLNSPNSCTSICHIYSVKCTGIFLVAVHEKKNIIKKGDGSEVTTIMFFTDSNLWPEGDFSKIVCWVTCHLPSPSHDSDTVQIHHRLLVLFSQFTSQLNDVIKLIFSADSSKIEVWLLSVPLKN